jgi:hypothetical protein
MSSQHLATLGHEILRSINGDRLKAQIALTSLEDVHRHLILERPESKANADGHPWQPLSPLDPLNAGRARGEHSQTLWDESYPPAVIGPQFDQEMMAQASSIPFLYHRQ